MKAVCHLSCAIIESWKEEAERSLRFHAYLAQSGYALMETERKVRTPKGKRSG
jgi:hypothetical protein